jgi:hypothetical protein
MPAGSAAALASVGPEAAAQSGAALVTWSVVEGSACGAISSAGLYTAPGAPATCHVVATSAVDGSKSATATVTIAPGGTSIAISPNPATVSLGGTQQFTVNPLREGAGSPSLETGYSSSIEDLAPRSSPRSTRAVPSLLGGVEREPSRWGDWWHRCRGGRGPGMRRR